jgi:hypothetical protein
MSKFCTLIINHLVFTFDLLAGFNLKKYSMNGLEFFSQFLNSSLHLHF